MTKRILTGRRTLTDKRVVLNRIARVMKIVEAEISANAASGKYGAGLSTEGFAGGYLDALRDVDAALRHGFPSDHRHYWRKAERTE